MSRSPKRSIRQAAHALDQLISVIEAHPDARRELVDEIGEQAVRDLESMRAVIQRIAERIAPGA